MKEIRIPTLNSNDDSCVLQEWTKQPGAAIGENDVLAILVTSKANFDLTAEAKGIFHPTVKAGAECPFGSIAGYVFEDEAARQAFETSSQLRPPPAPDAAALGGVAITAPARRLMEEHGIQEAQIRALGKTVIRQTDVRELVAKSAPQASPRGDLPGLSRRQQAVAKVVSLSHSTIPSAFLLMRVYFDETLARLAELRKKTGAFVGTTEVIVRVVSQLAGEFPLFFGPPGSRTAGAPVNIGLTIDAGTGLFIPVLKAAEAQPLERIGEALTDFRERAVRDAFKEEDFAAGHISLSLNPERDCVMVIPIIVPGQTCMVSVAATFKELALAPSGALTTKNVMNIGVAYDHRYINGFDAMNFLTAVKKRIESPGDLFATAPAAAT